MTVAVEAIAGVGPGLALRLRNHFGGEAPLQEALDRRDVAAIAAVEGVGPKRARRIVLGATGALDPAAFLATEAATRLWDGVVEMAQHYCGTPAGADRVALRPLARSPEEAAEQAADVMSWCRRIEAWDRDAVRKALLRMRPLTEPRPARAMEHSVVCDEDARARLEALGADRWVGLAGPEALRRPEGLILVLGEVDAPDAAGILELPVHAGLADVAPEAVLSWFRTNRPSLEALDALLLATGQEPLAAPAMAVIPVDGRNGPTLDLAGLVAQEHAVVQDHVRRRVEGLALTGADLLAAMDDRLPPSIAQVVREEIDAAHKRIAAHAGHHVAAFLPGRPVAVDEEAVSEAGAQLQERQALARHQRLVDAARRLAPMRRRLEAAHRDALAWEADFAWACLALDKRLQPAGWGKTLRVSGGLHMGLPRDGSAQPIAYELGGDAPVALLTGANSGGKTTLLEMLGQVVVMARFGLPVPADGATAPWFGSLHLLTHRRSLDAGAFESFLRRFLPLSEPGPTRLVLADEVEAITELSAAARILGFFLRRLAQRGHIGLFVTHMAPLLLESGLDVRVDGIQSTGLAPDGSLIVDRVPRIGMLATSTPELIIERIARSDPAGLWGELLDAVRGVTPK